MGKIDDLLEGIREHKKKYDITEQSSEADKLRYEIMKSGKSEEEWLELQKRVREFFQSDASEEDKMMLSGYTECLLMACNGIEYERNKASE